jgi:hypothetical protein
MMFRTKHRWSSTLQRFLLGSTGTIVLLFLSGVLLVPDPALAATRNPGDPLYCQPDEGATFLIVNGNSGVFTTYSNCYNPSANVNNDNVVTQPTHGSLVSDGTGNYVYTATPLDYTGLDTFQVHVDRSISYVSGGPGDFSEGPGNITITLNVLPSSLPPVTTASGTPVSIAVPAGSVSPCPATFGCVTGARVGTVAPAHGTLNFSGLTATYTPASGYSGTDSFTIQALGHNNDGSTALNSGNIAVQVTVAAPVPSLGTWGMIALTVMLMLSGLGLARKHA